MSGIAKGLGKAFKRLTKSKVARGLLIAVATYYVGGMVSGSMGDANAAASSTPSWGAEDAIDMGSDVAADTSASWAAGDAIDAGVETPFDAPAPDATAGVPAPQVAAPPPPAPQTPQPAVASAAATPDQPAAVQPPASTPAAPAAPATSTVLGKAGDASGSQGAWFKGLSPGAQAIIAGAMTGGAGAAMQALATKSAREDEREREERAREDKIRRGTPAAYGAGAFKPKGLITGNMG